MQHIQKQQEVVLLLGLKQSSELDPFILIKSGCIYSREAKFTSQFLPQIVKVSQTRGDKRPGGKPGVNGPVGPDDDIRDADDAFVRSDRACLHVYMFTCLHVYMFGQRTFSSGSDTNKQPNAGQSVRCICKTKSEKLRRNFRSRPGRGDMVPDWSTSAASLQLPLTETQKSHCFFSSDELICPELENSYTTQQH
ncbi:uncharacterized protein V6R79_001443 [Siganus canaliculatus]